MGQHPVIGDSPIPGLTECGERSSGSHVRSLERGLRVLQALGSLREASVSEIALRSGLPRPTVHRLIDTLAELGFVARCEVRGRVRPTSLVRSLASGYRSEDDLSVVAYPVLERLQRRASWPVSLAVYGEDCMVLRVNTHRGNPLSLARANPGMRLPLLSTSMGRAYLAACSPHEQHWIVEALRKGGVPVGARDLLAVEQARKQGYAVRAAGGDGRTSSLAVAIPTEPRPFACINIEWIDSVLPMSRATEHLSTLMRAGARRIARSYLDFCRSTEDAAA